MKTLVIALVITGAAAVLILIFRNGEEKSIEIVSITPDIVEETKNLAPELPPAENELKTGTEIGNLAPDFETETYDGKTVNLSDFKGRKPVFLNFWASWCPFCIDEMPLIAGVQEEFSDRYVTLMVNRGESLKTAKKFSDQVGVTQRMLLVLDSDDDIYGRYGGFAMPYSLFIDKNGVIRDIKLGPLQEQELKEKIQKIL